MRLRDCKYIIDAFIAYQGLARLPLLTHKSGLTNSQTMVMNLLGFMSDSKLNMSSIAKGLGASNEQASRTVSGLESKGFVLREKNAQDRKQVQVSLTEEGRVFIAQLTTTLDGILIESLSELSEDEKDELIEVSKRATELLRKALGSVAYPPPAPLER